MFMSLILRNVAIFGGAAVALGSVLPAEWAMLASPGAPPPIIPTRFPDQTERNASISPDPGRMQGWVATLLARPLFAQDRRPSKLDLAPTSAGPELPRLAGVMVSAQGSSAIFAAVGGGKVIVIGTGASIGGFIIQKIEAGQVTLVGADGGMHLLRPSFDSKLASTRSDSPGPKSPAASTLVAPRPRPAAVVRSAPPGASAPRQPQSSAAPSR